MAVLFIARLRGTEGTLALQRKLYKGQGKSFIFLAFLKGISFMLKRGIFSLSLFLILAYIVFFFFALYNKNVPFPGGFTTA